MEITVSPISKIPKTNSITKESSTFPNVNYQYSDRDALPSKVAYFSLITL